MNPGSIVLIPFPFSDLTNQKLRPALVLSNETLKGEDLIACAISSQKDSQDLILETKDLTRGSLPLKSFIKCHKICTLKKSMIHQEVAQIEASLLEKVLQKLNTHLG